MRFWVLSDLHLEFDEPPPRVPSDAQLLIAAGDIGVGLRGALWLKSLAPLPVIYIAGNHEYYGHSIPRLTEKLHAACQNSNVHFLENESRELFGVRFLGCTLWTDFELFGADRRPAALAEAGSQMTDFRLIRVSPRYRHFTPVDAARLCRRSAAWLHEQLALPTDHKTIVVTHHAPHLTCLDPIFRNDLLSAAYASDLSPLLTHNPPTLWIHGHNHRSHHQTIANTPILANQRGYPNDPRPGFDAARIIEI